MPSHIELTVTSWKRLKEQLQRDYPPSVVIIRSKMKSVLGFTDRTYYPNDPEGGYCRPIVCLDFFSEKKRTFFLMKYSELLETLDKPKKP